jgi:hypothetical protein
MFAAFFLESCHLEREKNVFQMASDSIPELVLDTYNSMNTSEFSSLCHRLNDSIYKRKDCFLLNTATFINENTHEIRLGMIEIKSGEKVLCAPVGLILHVRIVDANTILMENECIKMTDFKEKARKFVFEPDGTKRDILMTKKKLELYGEVEVSKVGVSLSIKADGHKVSDKEWMLFFNCLHELVDIYENERNHIAIQKSGMAFESLTFEQKKEFCKLIGYPIMLHFDKDHKMSM